ncbi:MAG: TonB-dependent receptor, partial [Chloroflexi bacterium]|nr:TonB-dependent receptor [Chloroflexota bacterium]
FAPSPPRVVEVGDAGEVAVELEYRLNIVAEVRAPPPQPEPLAMPGTAATVLDARQITAQPGSLEDVFRVLQMSPGVAAVDDNRNDLLVRGAGPIETETRVDGFSVPNASHFAGQGGTAGGLSMVPPWLIERASLEAGGFSVAFGERASSVVDLTLRSGNTKRLAGAVAAGVGGGWAVAEGPLAHGRGSWLASVRRSFLELIVGGLTEDHIRPRYFDGAVKADVWLTARHRLGILVLGGQDNVVSRSSVDNFETFRDDQTLGVAGVRLASQWSSQTSSHLAVSATLNDLDVVSRDRRTIDFRDNSREAEIRVTAGVTRRLGRLGDLAAGASVKRADLSFDLFEGAFRNEFGNLVVSVSSRSRDTLVDAAGHAELTTGIGGGLRTRVGIRVDRSGATGEVYGSPRVRAEYQLGAGVRVSGAVGLYRQGIPYVWIGSRPQNARLDPIKSRQIMAGLDVRRGKTTRFLIEAFDKRYTGYPVDPVAPARVLISALADFESPFVGGLVAAGRVHARGIDTAFSTLVAGRLEAGVSYSFWDVTQQGLDGTWRPGDYDIRHQARLAAGYSRRPWRIGAAWRYASGRPYTPFDAAASVKAGAGRYDKARINGERYRSYHRLDVRVERAFTLGRITLVAYGEINNAYDRANIFMYEWNRTARAPRAMDQWGRVPVAGVRAEF